MNQAFKRRRLRIGALTFALAGLFLLALMRLAMLVLIDGPRLASLAHEEHTAAMQLAAVRGPIVDRDGQPLALSAATRSIFARPRKLLENSTAAARARLALALSMTPAALEAKLKKPAPFVWLARHLAPARARAAEDLGFDSIGAVNEYARFYPESNLAAAVVGLAGTDGQGLSGVELQYDKLVRGAPVELQFYHDAFGHPILDSPLGLKPAQPGARLELTIDSSIQSAAENYLSDQVDKSGARRGAAVVLDPFTGEVLALANVDGVASQRHDRLHDTATQDAFEPGSTMKGILGAIALQDRAIAPNRQIYCENGEWHLAGRTIHDDSRHGWLDLGGVIEVSSNIGAAKIALSLGADRFYNGLNAFGIGRRSGIDLPGEADGLLRAPSKWRTIELADHGFGQGVAVTPIQLATAYAAIANGGLVMRPYVVAAAYDPSGHEILRRTPQVLRRAVSPEVAHQMNLLLRNVVNSADGTGRLAQVADFTVAGKTGTAQMVNPATGGYYQSRLVASFVGFLPADDPRLVILVVLYDVAHGHFGGLYAAPVFSQIASAALQRLEVAPANVPTGYETASLLPFADGANPAPASAASSLATSPLLDDGSGSPSADTPPDYNGAAAGVAPDFHGESLRGAFAIARARRVVIETSGGGYVIAQNPPPGAAVGDVPIQLTLSESAAAAQDQSHQGDRPSHPVRSKRAARSGPHPWSGR
ncbi:MAG: penicillin-binding transpeptidase domain-containing protein [Candidatus Binataceae bacterium]